LVDVDSYVVFVKARTLRRQSLLPCAGNGRWDPLRNVGWRLIPIANYPLEICILYVYIEEADIDWDPEKARSNLKKHGVCFSDAEMVLSDPNGLTVEDTGAKDEQRFVTVGTDSVGRILVVVYEYRGEDIRLISARPATKRERTKYEEGI
jgi:uncharacterized DUF497 family protein